MASDAAWRGPATPATEQTAEFSDRVGPPNGFVRLGSVANPMQDERELPGKYGIGLSITQQERDPFRWGNGSLVHSHHAIETQRSRARLLAVLVFLTLLLELRLLLRRQDRHELLVKLFV